MPYRYVCNHWWSKSISYTKFEEVKVTIVINYR